jgi:glutamate synthase (NADPH/NADH) large chain
MPQAHGLYRPDQERDACGVGFIAHIKGRQTHAIVEQGLQILKNLTHRGAVGADPLAGDGAGILIQMPDAFLRREFAKQKIELPKAGAYAVGMLFLPRDAGTRAACEKIITEVVKEEGQVLLGWRDVPTNNARLGKGVQAVEPVVRQVLIGLGAKIPADAFERKLFVIRKVVEHRVRALAMKDKEMFYVPSLSSRTIVYKGMLLADQVGEYYPDLLDKEMVSALALVHQRFSTNTFPTWDLAHPFRMIAHNGEINTLRGNVNWMAARRYSAPTSTSCGR